MQEMGWFGVISGHSRSWIMPPFDTAHTISYSSLIETMWIMDKLQFFVLIFAVLLSKLCNASLLQSILKQFFDSLDGGDLPYKIV